MAAEDLADCYDELNVEPNQGGYYSAHENACDRDEFQRAYEAAHRAIRRANF